MAEGLALAPRRQRDVHAQHQQAVFVQALQVAGEEGELVFAQAPMYFGLALGSYTTSSRNTKLAPPSSTA